MSATIPCECGRLKGDLTGLVVTVYKGNASSFNGGRFQHSDYSEVKCTRPGCHGMWRTKAGYVEQLPRARFGQV